VVAIFPEGAIRRPEKSVTAGGSIRPGASRLAQMAGVPVVPAVVLNSAPYLRVAAWLPLKQVRYGLIYGEPIPPPAADDKDAAQATDEKLKGAMVALYGELRGAMERRGWKRNDEC
jgi:1-acyl-sn-glycerol-3-phosphate acyltransferase